MNAFRSRFLPTTGILLGLAASIGCFSSAPVDPLANGTTDDGSGSGTAGTGSIADDGGEGSEAGSDPSTGSGAPETGSDEEGPPLDDSSGGSTDPSSTGDSGSTDDGGTDDASTGESVDTSRRVFLLPYAGAPMSYGGTAGADAACQAAAEAVGLSGEYMAWLSATPMDEVAARFTQGGGPFVRVDGEAIAADWTDLTDGSLDAPISVTADGIEIEPGALPEQTVVTHTHPDGTHAGGVAPCVQFSADSIIEPRQGDALATDATWSEIADTWWCESAAGGGPSLYCFEQ